MAMQQKDMIKLGVAVVILLVAIVLIGRSLFSSPPASRPSNVQPPANAPTADPTQPPEPATHRRAPQGS